MSDSPKDDLTLRYVTGFRCIGAECEDTCCAGWKVSLERRAHDDLAAVMAADPAAQRLFAANITPVTGPTASPDHFAIIELDAAGRCRFLAADSDLCTIHGTYGEHLLGGVCSTYPRQLNRIGGRTELSLAMSCPEAARLCLLAPDALEEVPLPAELIANPRYLIGYDQAANPRDPYLVHAGLVRGVLQQMLGMAGFPLESRLFFMAWFAGRIESFYHLGTTTFTEDRLADELDRLVQPGLLLEWHEQLPHIGGVIDLPMTIILTILAGRERSGTSLSGTLGGIWAEYGWENPVRDPAAPLGNLDFSGVIPRYIERRDRLEAVFGERHEQHMTSYCGNFLFREPLGQAPGLTPYLQDLLIRRAIIRFLIWSDPAWDDVVAAGEATDVTPELLARFDAASVALIVKVTRAVEHDPALTGAIRSTLAAHELQSLAHLVLLLQV